jgi:hypothetical protein
MAEEKDAEQLEHDEFMRRAKFCVDYAATLTDPAVKVSTLEMAARWRQLAGGFILAIVLLGLRCYVDSLAIQVGARLQVAGQER